MTSNVWTLLKKDLLRDSKQPWVLIIFMLIPVLTAVIMSLVFAPQGDIQKNITIHLALLDRDDDFLSGMLRSISNQGDATQNLRLHFVDTEEAGIKLVEKRKVSAFVVLPEDLTVDLLDGNTTTLTLYKNPAQTILPTIVEEGLNVLCIGVDQALKLLQPEMKIIRDMVDRDRMPDAFEAAKVASSLVNRLRTVEPYLFPPLIQFETVEASKYIADVNLVPAAPEDPNS
ncbi:MAG: ABC transporter permease [Planctomycetes bacterium]|nr:ABC transporter permease [Planctomycetota bacterium]